MYRIFKEIRILGCLGFALEICVETLGRLEHVAINKEGARVLRFPDSASQRGSTSPEIFLFGTLSSLNIT